MTTTEAAQVEAISRRRCARMMDAFQAGGFGSIEAGRIRVGRITLTGVTLDPTYEDGLRVARHATCEVVVELEVASSNLNWGGNMHGGCTAWLVDVATTLPIFCLQGTSHVTSVAESLPRSSNLD